MNSSEDDLMLDAKNSGELHGHHIQNSEHSHFPQYVRNVSYLSGYLYLKAFAYFYCENAVSHFQSFDTRMYCVIVCAISCKSVKVEDCFYGV